MKPTARLCPLDPAGTRHPYGITARTTRKSWEFWLLAACLHQIVRITLSQDHTETVALRHYIIAWVEPPLADRPSPALFSRYQLCWGAILPAPAHGCSAHIEIQKVVQHLPSKQLIIQRPCK